MRLSRRLFLRLAFYGLPVGGVAYAGWIEPRRLTVRRLNLAAGKPAHRFVHFTDLRHKGDRALLAGC